jgi:hypothetical protein
LPRLNKPYTLTELDRQIGVLVPTKAGIE